MLWDKVAKLMIKAYCPQDGSTPYVLVRTDENGRHVAVLCSNRVSAACLLQDSPDVGRYELVAGKVSKVGDAGNDTSHARIVLDYSEVDDEGPVVLEGATVGVLSAAFLLADKLAALQKGTMICTSRGKMLTGNKRSARVILLTLSGDTYPSWFVLATPAITQSLPKGWRFPAIS